MFWTVFGTIGLPIVLTVLGYYIKKHLQRDRSKFTTIKHLATIDEKRISEREHSVTEREARSFSLMDGRIRDLEGALDRVVNSERRLREEIDAKQATIDRLRDERDEAKQRALEAELRAMAIERGLEHTIGKKIGAKRRALARMRRIAEYRQNRLAATEAMVSGRENELARLKADLATALQTIEDLRR